MDAMESTSRGWWRPSPGSVYPMLQQLTEEGLAKRRDADGKYEITPQGREEIEWPARMQHSGSRSVDSVLADLDSYIRLLEDLAYSKDTRLAENAGKIKELSERLSKLGATS
jgi:DNA-binding PadR family transcriptional regulator